MDFGSNFNTHCTIEEAIDISRFLTSDIMAIAYNCYCNAYKSCQGETEWKIHSGLDAVYILGFISGSRAVRGARNNE